MIHPQRWAKISEDNNHPNLGTGDEQLSVRRFMIMTLNMKITQSSFLHRTSSKNDIIDSVMNAPPRRLASLRCGRTVASLHLVELQVFHRPCL